MLRVILAGLKARRTRLVLCACAIALGVAFVTGAMVLADSVRVELRAQATAGVHNVDVVVNPGRRSPILLNSEVLAGIRRLPGVASAEGRETASTPLIEGRKARDAAAVPLVADPLLRPFTVVSGRVPENVREIAVDSRAGYSPGRQVTLLAQDGQQRAFAVVGTIKPLVTNPDLGGGGLRVTLLPDALHTLVPDQGYGEIAVRAAPGTSQPALAQAIRGAVPGASVQTGQEAVAQLVRETPTDTGGLGGFLTAFAVLALVVAALVIHNTFTILIAQRSTELALLRCIGAGRRQVFTGVLVEALFMGVFASVVGFLAGLGISALLQTTLSSSEIHLPLALRTIGSAFAVGVLVTLIAAVAPARRATAVAPVAALRAQPDGDVRRTSKVRLVWAFLLAVVGVVAAVVGVPQKEDGIVLVGLGLAGFLGAVLVLGPILVGPFVRVLSVLPRKVLGLPAALATANADRNPRRTAATTAALTIGIMVVALVTTVAVSAQASAEDQLDKQFAADYSVTSLISGQSLPESLVTQLRGVATAAPMRSFSASFAPGGGASVTAVPGDAVGTLLRPNVVSGTLDRLRPGELAISRQFAQESGLTVGTNVMAGQTRLRVVAVYDATVDIGLAIVDLSALPADVSGYDTILVKGGSAAAVADIVAASPLAQLRDVADLRAQASASIHDSLAVLWALIGLAVVVALAGIANTLSLSVLERTRESALLRALGLTRGGLGAALLIEAVLMAAMGAVLGLLLGVGGAWLIVRTASVPLTVPAGQMAVVAMAAILAAPLATALPARRAALAPMT